MNETVFWLWFSQCFSTTSTVPKKIIEFFKTPENIYYADEEEYKKITPAYKTMLDKDLTFAKNIADYVEHNDIGILTYNDKSYPNCLKNIDNCPMLFYYVGNLYDFDLTPSIGIVGTRNYSQAGEIATKRISYDISRSGMAIVSGLAKGIDSFGHKAALYNKGKTVAVLGCGIDVIYPPENRELTLRMYKDGLVITEFAPGTPPNSTNFPPRNRIISALSDGILIVECGLKSGTIITANYARKQNKPVFAMEHPMSVGTKYLIEKGASAVNRADDITKCFKDKYKELKFICELPKEPHHKAEDVIITSQPLEKYKALKSKTIDIKIKPTMSKNLDDLNGHEKVIYNKLIAKPLGIDSLVDENMSVSLVLRTLTSLELKDYISALPGGIYVVN